ncbi:MAG: NAD(P)H-dependent oxidoreductase subunit E [Athalassotoga sp.]|uniref:NADH-quinone oxidoreductase subunit NuoE family protein n=1 Tax=Athalassotoga sp. TaxID=2022597 RepID=UPI00267FA071
MEKVEILRSRIKEVKSKQVEKGDMILSSLHLAQELFENSIPLEAAEAMAEELDVKIERIYEIATFYSMYSTKPRGKHLIRLCESLPCHVVEGPQIEQKLKDILKIDFGQTTKDGLFTLEQTSCLGICGVGPVMMIDGDAYGNLTVESIEGIIEKYRGDRK